MVDTMASNLTFDPISYLARAGAGRSISDLKPKENFFVQGDPADSVFYLQCGRAKLTVVSHQGKEATIAILIESAISWGRSPSQQCLDCAWPQPRRSTPALHSGLQGSR